MNRDHGRDHGCDSGDQEREDQRWRDEEREFFEGAGQRDPWTVLLDQCARIVQVHEHLRMDTDEDEVARVRVVETTRAVLAQAREHVASLASWLDEQIAEAERVRTAHRSHGHVHACDVADQRVQTLIEVRARLGGDDDTTTVREG